MFKLALHNTNWKDICDIADNNGDVSELYSSFSDRFCSLFKQHFPLRTFKMSKRSTPRQEWMTSGLIKSCNRKLVLYKNFVKNPTVITKTKYIKFKNKLKAVLILAKQKFYEKKFLAVSSDMRRTWKLLYHVINKQQCFNSVNDFIKYFYGVLME